MSQLWSSHCHQSRNKALRLPKAGALNSVGIEGGSLRLGDMVAQGRDRLDRCELFLVFIKIQQICEAEGPSLDRKASVLHPAAYENPVQPTGFLWASVSLSLEWG